MFKELAPKPFSPHSVHVLGLCQFLAYVGDAVCQEIETSSTPGRAIVESQWELRHYARSHNNEAGYQVFKTSIEDGWDADKIWVEVVGFNDDEEKWDVVPDYFHTDAQVAYVWYDENIPYALEKLKV